MNTQEIEKPRYRKGTLEAHLDSILPDWPKFNIRFHELWRDYGGGWSVNDSWIAYRNADREETIAHLRERWEVFKLNYDSKARVQDLCEAWSFDDDLFALEVDYTAFTELRKA